MSDTRFTVNHPFKEVLKVVENIEEMSEFSLKTFGSLAFPQKETHKTFDVLSKSHKSAQPMKCGSLELTEGGQNKTEIKFSQDFVKGSSATNTGLERFFFLLMQQFVQRGMKKFDK